MKIITFPFAGGSKTSYAAFYQDYDRFIVFEYPGRGSRINENLIKDIELLIDDLFSKIKNEIDGKEDYIIYGHSMGALVGLLICRKIQKSGLKKPQKLVVSGLKAPGIRRERKLAHLSDQEFWQEVIKLKGIPDELQNHKDWMEFYIPILKADFAIVENYQYLKKEKQIIPIDVFYGSEEATEEEMLGWHEETTEVVTVTKMPGNHFFIFNHAAFFVNFFKNLADAITP